METRHTLQLNFEPSPEAATMSGTLVLGAGGGFLLVLALTFLLLRSRRGEHDDVEALSPTAGPPISSTVHEKKFPEYRRRPPPLHLRKKNGQQAHQFPQKEFLQAGQKNSGDITANNTLMERCERPLVWQPIRLHGTHFGW